MADLQGTFRTAAGFIGRNRGLILPAMAAAMVFVILVPLPPLLLDVLLAANIALSAVILLTAIYIRRTLEFSVFPAVLLCATLLRLTLNIATTRLILTAGAEGRGVEEAQYAAGNVVWAFSYFVTANSLAVGVILFVVIAIIQFVVITKGTARVSEVHARFVLDAMPGKQMAIDADLNAGLIDEQQARQRRTGLDQEADFYGAMDGACKFIRGDAVAAVLITAVCILGGLYVGQVQYHWNWPQTVDLFTRLTIGEGLVMQVPAFIVSIAAALIVTRGAAQKDLGEEVVGQLTAKPVALVITAVFLGLLALTRLPKLPLAMAGIGCAALAWLLMRERRGAETEPPADAKPATDKAQNFEELLAVDPMRIELGYALVKLVDASQGGDLAERITNLRRQLAGEMGLLVPPIRVKDEMRIESHLYVIRIRGERVADGRLYPSQVLAIRGEGSSSAGKLVGRTAIDSASGREALWISPSQAPEAQMMDWSVFTAADALIRHLGEVIRAHAADLLTRQQVSQMLDAVKQHSGTLVAEVTEKLRVGQIQKVLQNLLRERVPIRDLEAILEALGEAAPLTSDTDQLTEHVRSALARTLSRQFCGADGKLRCICLEGELEETIASYASGGRTSLAVPPELASRLADAVADAIGELKRRGGKPVVLCAPQVRPALRKLLAPAMPDASVLSYSEIESVEVESQATVRI
ncbi:MAG: flagellar biosynthesis protein FlhA [Phycisphaerae bacterium]